MSTCKGITTNVLVCLRCVVQLILQVYIAWRQYGEKLLSQGPQLSSHSWSILGYQTTLLGSTDIESVEEQEVPAQSLSHTSFKVCTAILQHSCRVWIQQCHPYKPIKLHTLLYTKELVKQRDVHIVVFHDIPFSE